MSASIQIELLPTGQPGKVFVRVASQVSDGGHLSIEEIAFTLEQVLEGLHAGRIKPGKLPTIPTPYDEPD